MKLLLLLFSALLISEEFLLAHESQPLKRVGGFFLSLKGDEVLLEFFFAGVSLTRTVLPQLIQSGGVILFEERVENAEVLGSLPLLLSRRQVDVGILWAEEAAEASGAVSLDLHPVL